MTKIDSYRIFYAVLNTMLFETSVVVVQELELATNLAL